MRVAVRVAAEMEAAEAGGRAAYVDGVGGVGGAGGVGGDDDATTR